MTATVSQPTQANATIGSPAKNGTTPQQLASQDVGLIFVREYYTFLNRKPYRLHAFYNNDSYFIRGDEGETQQTYHGQAEISKKIEELHFEDCKVLVTQVDSQMSANNGIIIQVMGEMCNKNGPSQKFCQTFFLAPQPNGYYVLNDIFRFMKDDVDIDYYGCDEEDDEEEQRQQQLEDELEIPQPEKAMELAIMPISEPIETVELDSTAATVASTPVVEPAVVAQEEPAKTERVEAEAQEQIEKAVVPLVTEEKPAVNGVPKEAEASGATKEEFVLEENILEQPRQPHLKHSEKTARTNAPKTWANLAANDSSKWGAQAAETKGAVAAAPVQSKAPAPLAVQPTQPQQPQPQPQQPQTQPQTQQHQAPQQHQQQSHGHGHGHNNREQRREETNQIFVKNVTSAITEEQLREAFSKFGPIKVMNIAPQRNCAFLDFTSPEAAQKALNQHKVPVGSGVVVLAEERRHGGNRHSYNRQQQSGAQYERRFQQHSQRRGGGGGGGAPTRGGGNKMRGGSQK
ncbi:hypothetical protein DFQ28_000156 [Apophysomyces sp. BC1034]|nr:hypothetical protein DFQ30_002202 [Apophysomyces sp. BC1015]KAG0178751.1 hypothetical protein DFQ29_003057 [Apophysomyces sp. BC1021]KAG0191439.1 hypothetical protein DFQ28_000156 [Apophysomyces sp. BC1034]